MHFDSSARQFRLRRPGGVDTRHQWRCRLVVRPIWALALSPILGSRPGPQRGWAEPLPGRSDPAVPAAGCLIRGGGLCASVDQSGGAYAGRTGPSTRLPRSGLFTTTPASPSHASLLALQTCRGWNGRKRGQSPPSEPSEQGAGGGCCHVKSLDGPMDDNQAAQACFEPSRCRLARRFAHERDEMDRQTARITGEQCARRLQMCGWTLGSVDAATSGML